MTEKEVLQIVKRALREERKAIAAEVKKAIGNTYKPMTVKQAAEYSGYAERTLRGWMVARELPYYKAGKVGQASVRIDKSDLDALIFAVRVPSDAELEKQAAQIAAGI